MKLPWSEKRMFWAFEKGIFQFFANFWVTKLKPFSGKFRQSLQNNLYQNLVIGNFLENDFEAILSSKMSFVSVWKDHFLAFWKFLSDKVETIFWKSYAKRSKPFKSKFGHRKLLRKWFWRYLQIKKEYCKSLKKAFFSFLEFFEWQSLNDFLGKWRKTFKSI